MLSSHLQSVFLVLALVVSSTIAFPTFGNATTVEIVSSAAKSELNDFLKESGFLPLSRSRDRNEVIRYIFGSRDYLNDKIVSQGSGWKSSSSPQNYEIRLDYPCYGKGALISYVEVNLEQNSKEGRAYILSGGIKERNIVIMAEANDTYSLKFSFRIYGNY